MSYQNAPYPAYPQPPQQPKKRGGLATASLVLGIVGLVLAVIPFVNFVAYPLVILALIFGIFAFRWGKGKAGFILGVVGLIATIVWTAAIVKGADDAVNKEHTVAYTVTGSGTADIQFDQFTPDGKSASESAEGQALPWTKTFTIKGSFSAFSVSATASGEQSGTLACMVKVDGKTSSSDSATGRLNVVTCSGSGYDGG